MSTQTYLTENPPIILDATCSTKKIWPRYASLRMDIKRDVHPDICASAAYLPFRDRVFQEIYCDPPHMIRHDLGKYPYTSFARNMERFGAWKDRKEWECFLDRFNHEAARTLKQEGQLRFKLAYGADPRIAKRDDLNRLSAFEITKERITNAIAPFSNNKTSWLTMRPKS